jgi:NAD(P)H-dependent flavin oxidoreductase YrpB (nitropropane dioxygenase family)
VIRTPFTELVGVEHPVVSAVRQVAARAREITSKPIGINLLLHATEERIDEVLQLEPTVFSTAWPRDDQDLAAIFARAHDRGIRVMHMVPRVEDAVEAAEAGAPT